MHASFGGENAPPARSDLDLELMYPTLCDRNVRPRSCVFLASWQVWLARNDGAGNFECLINVKAQLSTQSGLMMFSTSS